MMLYFIFFNKSKKLKVKCKIFTLKGILHMVILTKSAQAESCIFGQIKLFLSPFL